MTELSERLRQDLAEVTWKDLRLHLQRDAIILVANELDMIDTALAVAKDDKTQVQGWLTQGQLKKPTAEQIAAWEAQPDQPFRVLIVQPFILAQQIEHA